MCDLAPAGLTAHVQETVLGSWHVLAPLGKLDLASAGVLDFGDGGSGPAEDSANQGVGDFNLGKGGGSGIRMKFDRSRGMKKGRMENIRIFSLG